MPLLVELALQDDQFVVDGLGRVFLNNLRKNVPVVFDIQRRRLLGLAQRLLQQLPAEQNKITKEWNELGLKVKNAFDSQAVIELYNNFCQKRQCLNCSIGISILKPQP